MGFCLSFYKVYKVRKMVLNVLKKFGTFEQQVAKSEIEHAKTVAGYALVSWKSWKSWKWRINSDESADQSGKWRTRIGCKSIV